MKNNAFYLTDDTPNVKKNTRKHIREVRKNISVTISKGFLSKDPGSAFLIDISSHGAAICCRKLFIEKTLLRLNLTFDENVAFSLKGKIRHMQKKEMIDQARNTQIRYFQYGIEFEEQPPEFCDYLISSNLRNKLNKSASNPSGSLS